MLLHITPILFLFSSLCRNGNNWINHTVYLSRIFIMIIFTTIGSEL